MFIKQERHILHGMSILNIEQTQSLHRNHHSKSVSTTSCMSNTSLVSTYIWGVFSNEAKLKLIVNIHPFPRYYLVYELPVCPSNALYVEMVVDAICPKTLLRALVKCCMINVLTVDWGQWINCWNFVAEVFYSLSFKMTVSLNIWI